MINKEQLETYKSLFSMGMEKAFTKFPKYIKREKDKAGKYTYTYTGKEPEIKKLHEMFKQLDQYNKRIEKQKDILDSLKDFRSDMLSEIQPIFKKMNAVDVETSEVIMRLQEKKITKIPYKKLYDAAYVKLSGYYQEQLSWLEEEVAIHKTRLEGELIKKSADGDSIVSLLSEILETKEKILQLLKAMEEGCAIVKSMPKMMDAEKAKKLYTDNLVSNRTEADEIDDEEFDKDSDEDEDIGMGFRQINAEKAVRMKRVELMKAIQNKETSLIKSLRDDISKAQKRHTRVSKKGKPFQAGQGAPAPDLAYDLSNITSVSDKVLLAEQKQLDQIIHVDDCYGTIDVTRLDKIEEELDRRGFDSVDNDDGTLSWHKSIAAMPVEKSKAPWKKGKKKKYPLGSPNIAREESNENDYRKMDTKEMKKLGSAIPLFQRNMKKADGVGMSSATGSGGGVITEGMGHYPKTKKKKKKALGKLGIEKER